MQQLQKKDVSEFLSVFKQKMKVYGISYHYSDENSQTLLDLDISPGARNKILLKLKTTNYYKGPNKDHYDPKSSPVWEFGIFYNNNEIYIKISFGKENKPVLCKSFHFPKRKITYPFKRGAL